MYFWALPTVYLQKRGDLLPPVVRSRYPFMAVISWDANSALVHMILGLLEWKNWNSWQLLPRDLGRFYSMPIYTHEIFEDSERARSRKLQSHVSMQGMLPDIPSTQRATAPWSNCALIRCTMIITLRTRVGAEKTRYSDKQHWSDRSSETEAV